MADLTCTDGKITPTEIVDAINDKIGKFIDSSIAISYNDTALALDDTTDNGNIAIGTDALATLTTGYGNIAIGDSAANTTNGIYNVAIGPSAYTYGNGSNNVAIGPLAMAGDGTTAPTGTQNIAIGPYAMEDATTATNCIALGESSLKNAGTGDYNIAFGYSAMLSGSGDVAGDYNLALGYFTLSEVTSGYDNIAIGRSAGISITQGYQNVLIGADAGGAIETGDLNIYIGYLTGYYGTGSGNIGIGEQALYGVYTTTTGANNIAIGYQSGTGLTTGANNILIGYQAGDNLTTQSNQLVIGDAAVELITGDFSTETLSLNARTTIESADSPFVTTEDNSIAFNSGNNLSFTATAAGITVTNQTAGQSGTIKITNGDNITSWSTEFTWANGTVPTDLDAAGSDYFAYSIIAASGAASIVIARI